MPKPNAIMNLEKGEKFYKFFFFRPQAGRHIQFEYRVFTKLRTDGRLELAAYNFKVINGQPHKGEVLTSSEVPPEQLQDIIRNVMRSTNTLPHEFEEINLSRFATVQEQVDYLKTHGRADVSFLH